MECGGKLDSTSRSSSARVIKLLLYPFLLCALQVYGSDADDTRVATAARLYAENRWSEVVEVTTGSPQESPEMDWYRGLALARMERWEEARSAFEAGWAKKPADKRFPIELAGVEYKEKKFSQAKTYIKLALKLDPGDAYARDFLATLYFLDGNLEAAVDQWNRTGKPEIADVRWDPAPKVRPTILNSAFAFSPLSVMRLEDLRTTEERLRNLQIFSRFQFELSPAEENAFKATLRSAERNGWGDGKLDGLLSLFRGLPYQTIFPEYYNLKRSAMNVTGLVRWDAQKRRLYSSLSFPLEGAAQRRLQIYFDGRNENWDLNGTFQAAASPITDLKLRKEEVGIELRSVINGRWSWHTAVSFAHRDFGHFAQVNLAAEPLFTTSSTLKYGAGLDFRVLQSTERRLTIDSSISAELGKAFTRPLGVFGKVGGGVSFHWFPQARGNDYEVTGRFRLGRVDGRIPFDEVYMLGLERDNDLWMRGISGTRDGKKGSALLGRNFVLWNGEIDKIVYQGSFFTIKLGPFLDVGRINDSSGSFGSSGWAWNPGGQCKISVLGSFTVVLSYGRDIHGARNTFYATALH